jgi:hypothetical protein
MARRWGGQQRCWRIGDSARKSGGFDVTRNSRFGQMNSRFDGNNSRLGAPEFPFAMPREFSRKALISAAVSTAKVRFRAEIREYFPSNREFGQCPTGRWRQIWLTAGTRLTILRSRLG